jgi:hypothetical protein
MIQWLVTRAMIRRLHGYGVLDVLGLQTWLERGTQLEKKNLGYCKKPEVYWLEQQDQQCMSAMRLIYTLMPHDYWLQVDFEQLQSRCGFMEIMQVIYTKPTASRLVHKSYETLRSRHPSARGFNTWIHACLHHEWFVYSCCFDILAWLKLYRGKPVILRGHSFAFWLYGPIIVVRWSSCWLRLCSRLLRVKENINIRNSYKSLKHMTVNLVGFNHHWQQYSH